MENEQKTTLWDKAKSFESREWLPKIQDGETIELQFEDDGKDSKGNFGPQIVFNVTETKENKKYAFGVKQISIIGQLKPHRPLQGKTFKISRTGKGITDTKFIVKLVESPEDESGYSQPKVEENYI